MILQLQIIRLSDFVAFKNPIYTSAEAIRKTTIQLEHSCLWKADRTA